MNTKEDILNCICHGDNNQGFYFMSPDSQDLQLCEELETEGLIVRVDRIDPGVSNSSYAYVSNDERGKSIATKMIRDFN